MIDHTVVPTKAAKTGIEPMSPEQIPKRSPVPQRHQLRLGEIVFNLLNQADSKEPTGQRDCNGNRLSNVIIIMFSMNSD